MYKVCFVLPGVSRQPVGGYKMVFEYSNRLVAEGCNVSILFINDDKYQNYKVPNFVRNLVSNFETRIQPKWFALDPRVKKISSVEQNYKDKLVDLDVCIATAVQTVHTVCDKMEAKKKAYYIQDYENWYVTDEYVEKTFGAGLENIVISTWLKNIVDKKAKSPSVLIQNPIDTSVYVPRVSMSHRAQHTVGLLYNEGVHKGVKNAFEVLKRVKKIYPDLTVKMFGQFPKPSLPEWVEYIRGASQAETVDIYNWCQVFLCSTIKEGYGLTGIEAMACGACLVSTDYDGAKEYAVDGYNALLSPVGDIQAQVDNVVRLFEDMDLRNKISQNGIKSADKYSWDEAMRKFNEAIGVSALKK